MNTRIYYFSGTGNCLAVANQIARHINAQVAPISKAILKERILLQHEQIGIVFPAYLSPVLGVPMIVERFLRLIVSFQNVRVFAVCTCGGYPFANAFSPLEKMRLLIRACGGTLYAEYSVRMPMNNLDYDHIPVPISRNIPKIICNAERKTDSIAKRISQGKKTRFVWVKWVACRFVELIYRAFRKQTMHVLLEKAQVDSASMQPVENILPLTDRSIVVRDACIGCGTCARVCPVQNIVIKEGRPTFLHHCEMCFACDEWCLKAAIQHWSRGEGVKYHYPDIQWADLLLTTDTPTRHGS